MLIFLSTICFRTYSWYLCLHFNGIVLLYLKTHTPSCIFSNFWSFRSTWRATCTFILIRLDINKTLTNKWQYNFFKCNFSLYNRSYKISIDLTGANRPNNVRHKTTGNLEIGKRNLFYLKFKKKEWRQSIFLINLYEVEFIMTLEKYYILLVRVIV